MRAYTLGPSWTQVTVKAYQGTADPPSLFPDPTPAVPNGPLPAQVSASFQDGVRECLTSLEALLPEIRRAAVALASAGTCVSDGRLMHAADASAAEG